MKTFLFNFAAGMSHFDTVAIVKYNAGNVRSVINAFARLGVEAVVTDDADALRHARRVVFPGQGEAAGAMAYLREHGLDKVILSLTQPVLAICVGQQLLCRHSEEGDTPCLGLFDADVRRFRPTRHEDKVPAMGWQAIHTTDDPLFDGLEDAAGQHGEPYAYFVHSYYVPTCQWTIARADYITPYSAAMRKDNFWATQFHPEKSGEVGMTILRNFMRL